MAAGNEYLIHVEFILVAVEYERVISLGMSADSFHPSNPPVRELSSTRATLEASRWSKGTRHERSLYT